VIHTTSLDELSLPQAWLTIGIFDGVHRGHRALIKRLVEGSHEKGLPAVVLTFQPHPAVVLGKNKNFKSLTTMDERVAILKSLGVDIVIAQRFSRTFANQTAGQFMEHLVRRLGLRHLVIGYDTALGRGREGNAGFLASLGTKLGYEVEVVNPVYEGDGIISSGAIRSLILEGDVEQANALLGYPYAISGEVIHGDGRGRHINIPTANIDYPSDKCIPANGIYATWAWVQGKRFLGATNIGINPTFTPDKKVASLETHVLDINQDLYGQQVKLEFIARLREEMRFQSVEELVRQIHLDIAKTRQILQ
jgi:riboflavin kinase/FMN adenylyltransferase